MDKGIDELQAKHQKFINKRNWGQFHTPKSIAMSIAIEASELMELFQWHDNLSSDQYHEAPDMQSDVEEELADVIIYCLSMASEFDLDIKKAIERKLSENSERFDQEKADAIRQELERWQK